jgi:hypothetical protein
MLNITPTPAQLDLAASPERSIFLEGIAGTGKTSTGIERLLYLVSRGIPANEILVLIPQRTLAAPYFQVIKSKRFPSGSLPTILTMGGLARRMINLFWPLIVAPAGFANKLPPTHLTLETAQYYLSIILASKLEEGGFDAIHLDRNRIFGQILDNLNKSALVGFPVASFGSRLQQAWNGRPEQLKVYEQAQECALLFRKYCMQNNLLDYSLQIEIFSRHLWPSFIFQKFLKQQYRQLIFDNIEEDAPVVHDMAAQWLPDLESAFLIFDSGAGFRSFLAADPESGYRLKQLCDLQATLTDSFTISPQLEKFKISLCSAITRQAEIALPDKKVPGYSIHPHQYFTDMVNWTAENIADLVFKHHIPPGEICVLSPYLSDSLRFALVNRLAQYTIPVYSRRPSRSLREEKANLCLLNLACVAHPDWGFFPSKEDVRAMLVQSIAGLDMVRADLLVRICYHPGKKQCLTSFEEIQPDTQMRISYAFGERFDALRTWLIDYQKGPPLDLDIFLSRVFGEVLSQSGFGFHSQYDAAAAAARLIESIYKFRKVTAPILIQQNVSVGKEYLRLVREGVISAQYLEFGELRPVDAIFLAPAHTFIMTNQAVEYQFWLDIGSQGWWERLNQPLTHPHVLSRHWQENQPWTDAEEIQANQQAMSRLVSGLLNRCRRHVFLCASGVNEQGNEESGHLAQAIQKITRKMQAAG